ncbi:hypothetical protein [uncultured Thiohalocapsa sp.]|uniref:hypothetical protein n=1 Tax=uncultured Thiohalocapsa sp. TaxID=768990 RepID=UPI0025E0673E|nr:hypothetical protein [uncultured Thiohalocapsa sp.]
MKTETPDGAENEKGDPVVVRAALCELTVCGIVAMMSAPPTATMPGSLQERRKPCRISAHCQVRQILPGGRNGA